MKMDKDDIIYAERFLEILKENKRGISVQLYERVHLEYKDQPIKQHLNYNHILKELERLGLVEIEHLNKNVKKISLLEKAQLAISFKDERAKAISAQYRYGQLKTGLGLPSVLRLLRQWLQDIFPNAHKANCFGKFGLNDKAVSGQNIRNFSLIAHSKNQNGRKEPSHRRRKDKSTERNLTRSIY